jgi:iron complex outermembrane receptor protein
MRPGALAALCLVPVGAAAQTGVVHGIVRGSDGRALPQALVQELRSSVQAYTDTLGAYRLALARGVAIVRIELIGYARRVDTLRLDADSLRHDVTLQKLPGILLHEEPLPPPVVVDDTSPHTPIDTFALKPVVVTGAKRSQLLEDAFTSVAVVAPEQLAARAVNTVDEAVDKAPGVQFLNGQVNIRGSTGYVQGLGSRVLLLVDGVPANQGDRGGINWDLVPASEIERVEVVKGAGSALYGSAAMGGVVNLITREMQSGTHGSLRATGGIFADPPYPQWSFRTDPGLQQRIDGYISHGFDRVAVGLGAGYHHSDGYREQDARDRWNVSAKGRWRSADLLTTLDLSGAWTHDEFDVPLFWCVSGRCSDTRGESYQPFRVDSGGLGDHTVSRKGYAHAVLQRTPSERLRWQARGSWLRTRFTDHQRAGDDASVANRLGVEVRGEVHPPGDRVVTTVGVEGTRADVASNFFGNHTQGEYAAYGESERRFGNARATVGARMDFLAVDGGGLTGVLSPRIGAVFHTALGATRASAGRAFRAPSIAERFVNTVVSGLTVVPNPALTPETAWSFELGQHTRVGPVEADLAAFWTEADDLIEPAFVIDTVADTSYIQFQNLTRARLAGLDFAATVTPLPNFSGTVGYTFLYARELAQPGRPARALAFRPRHLVTLTADYGAGPATFGADFRFMSRMERVELFDGDTRVAAKVLDLRAAVTRGAWSGRLLVTNALNYIYTLVPRTLAPVRTVSLTLSWEY